MNAPAQQDVARWSAAEEGQFFERKSALDRSGGRPKPRKAADVARDIAETLEAIANADGGELVVGLENDGAVSGVPHAEDKLRLLLGVPKDRNYVDPPIPCRARKVSTPDGLTLLHLEADWSPNVHLLADSRCLRRVQDQNAPFDKDQVRALKEAKAQGLFERSFPAGARMEDLDEALLTRFAEAAGSGAAHRDALTRFRLTEGRNGHAVPTLAALLLFGRDPGRWHERAGIDFVRWEGTERKTGAELNVSKRFRIEAPLSVLPDRAFEAIKPFIRERQQLAGGRRVGRVGPRSARFHLVRPLDSVLVRRKHLMLRCLGTKNGFFGGVHPPEHKSLASDQAIEVFPSPAEVRIALLQHLGAPCEPTR